MTTYPTIQSAWRHCCFGVWAAIMVLLAPAATAQPPADGDLVPVRLQLKWQHQFQFAGYYAAIEKGFYRDAGFDVTLLLPEPDEASIDTVLAGGAEFGVASSDLVVRFAQGDPVVALAPIYQHSSLILLVRADSGVSSLHELIGRPLAIEQHADELFAYFQQEGVPREALDYTDHAFDPAMLIDGDVVAISAYSTDEPFVLEQAGIDYHEFTPRSGGIDFYGDTLFTSRAMVEQHPDRVERFLDASLKGWAYAFANKEELVDLIHTRYSDRHSRAHLMFEAVRTEELVQPDLVELGYTNPGRWQHVAETYARLGMMPRNVDLSKFLYDRDSDTNLAWLFVVLAVSVCVTLVVLGVAIRFYRLNIIVRKQNEALEQALADITVLRSIIPICSYCKKIKNDAGSWQQMESYISQHTDIDFSHGVCVDCYEHLMAEDQEDDQASQTGAPDRPRG